MSGFFGVVSKNSCIKDLYYGTDYHSHLANKTAGIATFNGKAMRKKIHNIENSLFRTKFEANLDSLDGYIGIGCINGGDAQPLVFQSVLGTYAILTIGQINNLTELVDYSIKKNNEHFSSITLNEINRTEVIATIIKNCNSFEAGIKKVHELIDGSVSILILTEEGIYAARDYYGRTPVIIGKRKSDYCLTFESCAMLNLGYEQHYELGSGEIIFLSTKGVEKVSPANNEMKICSFLWTYYGYPATTYENVNIEQVRYNLGKLLAKNESVKADIVSGIPDSGTPYAIGYANASNLDFTRAFIKYTPSWSRSFIPQTQSIRNTVAQMKLIPIRELIAEKTVVLCEDSVVRGTQMKGISELLYSNGAKEVHLRVGTPPVLFNCKYLNFSSASSMLDFIARRAINKIEKEANYNIEDYLIQSSEKYQKMIKNICEDLKLNSLTYNSIDNVIEAIGLPKEKLCTYCYDGKCSSEKCKNLPQTNSH